MSSLTLSPRVISGAAIFLITVILISVGCILNIMNAKWASERRYLFWATTGLWVFLFASLALMFFLVAPWRYLVLGAYFVLLPICIYRVSLKRQVIREFEERKANSRTGRTPVS